ncbi:hypothetical protein [Nocardia nepalensis]|uniref:hypothetical protein n=1 Tax=Nocardia nepalensis TaxID=3375448 RepID=UPI003B6787E0
MSALRGGAADKEGNEYEDLWTALRIADLLHDRAHRIRLEPPGDAGVGIEFEIDVDGRTWGEQTKNFAKTWTIARLKTGDASGRITVLEGAKHQIELGRGYRLISSSTANPLVDLSKRARATTTIAEFKDALTRVLEPDFNTVVQYWDVSEEVAWRYLKNIVVEHWPESNLYRAVRQAFGSLYAEDPDLVMDAVGRFCRNHRHQNIATPQVAAFLKGDFTERLLAGNHATRQVLHRSLERQIRRVERFEPEFGLVPRSEAQSIIAKLEDPDSPQVVIVDGPAGYGKSAVVAEVAATLEKRGWFVAVARMEATIALPTSDHLGQHMGLSESPSVLLAGVADGLPGLLVVDQLDAVSSFSGRMPDGFDAVDEVREELQRVRNLKLMLVIRTVDLENDPRVRSLLRAGKPAIRHTVGKLSADQVREHLRQHDAHIPAELTIELLRTPLHFAVYARLPDQARRSPYLTLQDLYDRFTAEARERATARTGSIDWTGITSTLVAYLSETQTLTAPRAVLDEFPGVEIAALESEAVLVTDEFGISFLHETYFDYLFARAFVTGGGDLHDFLITNGQFLFRRAQTRQVLEYLAAKEPQQLRAVVVRALSSSRIRSHIKQVVVGVLRQLTPTPSDWAALEYLAWDGSPVGGRLLRLLSSPHWFDAVDDLGRWEGWLADCGRADTAAQQLISAARDRGERVAELFRPYVGASEEWRLRLRALIAWSMGPALVPFAVELIQAGYIDDVRGPIAMNSDFWSIVADLVEDDPVGAARLIGAYLDRAMARADGDGAADPFETEYLSRKSQGANVIQQVADAAPEAFVRDVLPFLVRLSNTRADSDTSSLTRWGRPILDSHAVDDTILAAMEDALQKLMETNPQAAFEAIEPFREATSQALRFLVCRTLAASSDSDDAIEWLNSDQRNLNLGWSDSFRYASHELITAHSPRCSEHLLRQLEAEILLGDKGRLPHYGQVSLLFGIDRQRMSTSVGRRIAELERLSVGPPSQPRTIVASFVGPPISHDASKRMSDENWLSALRKHTSERTIHRPGGPVGGASQLAGVLEARAKEQPERFARLALRFDTTIPMIATTNVIRAVGRDLDRALFADLCEHALATYGHAIAHAVCTALSDSEGIDERLVALIEEFSTSADPETGHTSNGSDDLFIIGLSSVRGAAALAAATALFEGGQHLNRLLPVVRRLAVDTSTAVRTCAARAVAALLKHDQQAALSIAERLFEAPPAVFDTAETERLLTHCLLDSSTRFLGYLQHALEGPPGIATRAGRVWAVAQHYGAIASPVSDDVRILTNAARHGAAEVMAQNATDSSETLALLFADPDSHVREAASAGLRGLADMQPAAQDALINSFLDSPAFAEGYETLSDSLEDLGTRLPPSALRVCEKVIDAVGAGANRMQGRGAHVGREVTIVVLRSYRQGDESVRVQCLDIIDRLVYLDAFGLDAALAEER